MIYAYIRVSTDRQTAENQRFEILKKTSADRVHVDQWIEETASGTRSAADRALGNLLSSMKAKDVLYVTELSRLGRSLMEIMSILHDCMERDVRVFAIKEGYELGNNISSKVLAFAFGLSAEIERNLISQRTREALERKKAEGMQLGRPKGSRNESVKLSGKEEIIRGWLKNKVSLSAMARMLGVDRQTVNSFISNRDLIQKL
ncbi:master DNA invertase Mpi family serine-type recombinase [Fibrivirga algicola]|uniref:Master DNA invertase Mpi family serine-type recombinase n=1 Tax=Fibrivirga algicola TaxID=2950420 RepID=A0ABX0QUA8_9BACT|nr:master DNA invertase Mpi family serine-type recombinase [Fibrivirga algicola]NID13799.1 master DNA invertase Mpi family serine-type recombinase [Fibrivirga algicola]